MKRLLTALFLLSLLSSGSVAAAESARARLDAFARGLHALSGSFKQVLIGADGRPGQASQGLVALSAPNEFRWETRSPYQQTIVADGSQVWLYDPALEQVTVRRQDNQEAHSPLAVITDLSKLDRDFHVSEQGEKDGLRWLRLTSKAAHPSFDYADLGFDRQGLARMMFRDQLGAVTDIRFGAWRRNPPLAAASFHFTPPKDAEVVGDVPDSQIRALKP